MGAKNPTLAVALVGSLVILESRMICPPPSIQAPVQFVGGSNLPIDPDHAHHEAEAEDVIEIVLAAATTSVQPLMMFSETLK